MTFRMETFFNQKEIYHEEHEGHEDKNELIGPFVFFVSFVVKNEFR